MPCGIVMPHRTDDPRATDPHLEDALAGLVAQKDDDWHLFLVDDASPVRRIEQRLEGLTRGLDGRATVVVLPAARSAGYARNVAIALATSAGYPLLLFNDADDVSHPRRVEAVCAEFAEHPEASVVFATWYGIDAQGRHVPREQLVPHLQGIRSGLDGLPHELEEPFVMMTTRLGYFTLTSATAVRTDVARRHPFPHEYSVEDLHTWYRYAADGGTYVFREDIPTAYRVTSDNAGSGSWERYGGAESFFAKLDRLQIDGFTRALDVAVAKGIVEAGDRYQLAAAFHRRTGTIWGQLGDDERRAESFAAAEDQLRLVASVPAHRGS